MREPADQVADEPNAGSSHSVGNARPSPWIAIVTRAATARPPPAIRRLTTPAPSTIPSGHAASSTPYPASADAEDVLREEHLGRAPTPS